MAHWVQGDLKPTHGPGPKGGPYEHRWKAGRCTVCGVRQAVSEGGCPEHVNVATAGDQRRLHRKQP